MPVDAAPAVSARYRPISVLLVEDNPADADLAVELMAESGLVNPVVVVTDGEQALAYLRGEGGYGRRPPPGLVLLDLNLPGIDGVQVLAEVRADPALAALPVILLTSSKAQSDIMRAQCLSATEYFVKPLDAGHLLEVMRSTLGFRVSVVAEAPDADGARSA